MGLGPGAHAERILSGKATSSSSRAMFQGKVNRPGRLLAPSGRLKRFARFKTAALVHLLEHSGNLRVDVLMRVGAAAMTASPGAIAQSECS
jgi:hypothetical protein